MLSHWGTLPPGPWFPSLASGPLHGTNSYSWDKTLLPTSVGPVFTQVLTQQTCREELESHLGPREDYGVHRAETNTQPILGSLLSPSPQHGSP